MQILETFFFKNTLCNHRLTLKVSLMQTGMRKRTMNVVFRTLLMNFGVVLPPRCAVIKQWDDN